MSIIATALKHLIAAGVTGDDLVRAVAEMEAATAPDTRSGAAKRQARYRERLAERNETHNEASQGITRDDNVTPSPSLDKSPQTPKINPNPAHTREGRAPAHTRGEPWACPEGVDPQHWRDFRANRRRKKLTDTDTAYAGQLRLLDRFANDEWPPGSLVQHAAEKGWGTIVDPSEYETPRNGQRTSTQHRQELGSPMLAGLQLLRAGQPG